MSEKERVYLSFHKSFVRENVPDVDPSTGEERAINCVTLPGDTVIGGRSVGGYQFFPLYVNQSKFDPDQRTVPLLADREVRLAKTMRDEEGNVLLDDCGDPVRDVVEVAPQTIKAALAEARKAWALQHSQGRSLRERANTARSGSEAAGSREPAPADRDIPF